MKKFTCAVASVLMCSIACVETKGAKEERDHAGICLELQRSAAQMTDPFESTRSVVVVVAYTGCLIDFYTIGDTDYAQDGVKGAEVFEDWATILCDPDEYDHLIHCEVELIEQTLDTVNELYQLRVTYTILDDEMTNKQLRVGPIPRLSLTESCLPTVNLESVSGDDANGAQNWHQNSFQDGSNASSEQSGCMKALIIRD